MAFFKEFYCSILFEKNSEEAEIAIIRKVKE
jgi:hypothetical protein